MLALTDGPRAVSVAAIADASGAPAGTLYHRFGSRDGILRAAWLRALEGFQARWLEAARDPDPLEAGVAMATSVVTFARVSPDDARLLLTLRPQDLLDADPDAEFRELQRAINAPLEAELRRVARALHGRADARALDGVVRATVDLPYGVVRRHAYKANHAPLAGTRRRRRRATTAHRAANPAARAVAPAAGSERHGALDDVAIGRRRDRMTHQHVSRPSTGPLLFGAPSVCHGRYSSAARLVEQRARQTAVSTRARSPANARPRARSPRMGAVASAWVRRRGT